MEARFEHQRRKTQKIKRPQLGYLLDLFGQTAQLKNDSEMSCGCSRSHDTRTLRSSVHRSIACQDESSTRSPYYARDLSTKATGGMIDAMHLFEVICNSIFVMKSHIFRQAVPTTPVFFYKQFAFIFTIKTLSCHFRKGPEIVLNQIQEECTSALLDLFLQKRRIKVQTCYKGEFKKTCVFVSFWSFWK